MGDSLKLVLVINNLSGNGLNVKTIFFLNDQLVKQSINQSINKKENVL